jgi:hypothetical protein
MSIVCQKNASHGFKVCLMFDPTQYDRTIEDELHWGGWDAIAFTLVHFFFLSIPSFFFFFLCKPKEKPQIHPPTKVLFRVVAKRLATEIISPFWSFALYN